MALASVTSSASASIVRLAPKRVMPHALAFSLTPVQLETVKSAVLVAPGHAAPVPDRKLRAALRAGVLKVRRPPWARKLRNVWLAVDLDRAGQAKTPASRPGRSHAPPPSSGDNGDPSQVVTEEAPAAASVVSNPAVQAVDSSAGIYVGGPVAVASGLLTDPGCLPPYGTFALGTRPPGCWRPYRPASPFNRPIPANPALMPNSAATVNRMLSFGGLLNLLAGTAGRGELDGGRPTFFSQVTDPLFTLHCTESWGTCAAEGAVVHVPDQALPAGGSDAHMTIVDQTNGWEYDLWGVESKPHGGGVLTFRWGGKTRIDGSGLGSDAVAAQYGTTAGVLRAEELASGHINHALFLGVHCDSGSWVYPATKGGDPCPDPGNAPAEGMRFQLAMSDDQIAALPVPGWKKVILVAMAHYGMIVGDTGGTWGIGQESGVVYTSFGQPDKWVTLAQQWNVPYYPPDQDWVFNLRDGVDWARYLRIVQPCVSAGTC
jgi:hypothetical protein